MIKEQPPDNRVLVQFSMALIALKPASGGFFIELDFAVAHF